MLRKDKSCNQKQKCQNEPSFSPSLDLGGCKRDFSLIFFFFLFSFSLHKIRSRIETLFLNTVVVNPGYKSISCFYGGECWTLNVMIYLFMILPIISWISSVSYDRVLKIFLNSRNDSRGTKRGFYNVNFEEILFSTWN